MRLQAVGVVATLLVSAAVVRADRPPRAVDRVLSPNGKYVAWLDRAGDRVVVLPKGTGGSETKLWEMRGHRRVVFLSDRPDYLVSVYQGETLLSIKHSADEVMLAFYRRGELLRAVTLGEVIQHPAKLPRTVSHLRWAESLGLSDGDRFRLLTAEGREYLFDVTTGRTLAAGPARPLAKPPVF